MEGQQGASLQLGSCSNFSQLSCWLSGNLSEVGEEERSRGGEQGRNQLIAVIPFSRCPVHVLVPDGLFGSTWKQTQRNTSSKKANTVGKQRLFLQFSLHICMKGSQWGSSNGLGPAQEEGGFTVVFLKQVVKINGKTDDLHHMIYCWVVFPDELIKVAS